MKKLLALTSLLVLSAPSLAGTATGNITVTAQVVDACSITGVGGGSSSDTTANFGVYMPGAGNVLGAGAEGLNMSVNCSLGTLYTASMSAGQNAQGTQRRMQNTGTSGNYLNYSLGLLDANGLLNDTVGASLPYVGTGVAVPLVLRGSVPSGQNARVGDYQDVVVLSISY